jgi:hypothetical protein
MGFNATKKAISVMKDTRKKLVAKMGQKRTLPFSSSLFFFTPLLLFDSLSFHLSMLPFFLCCLLPC